MLRKAFSLFVPFIALTLSGLACSAGTGIADLFATPTPTLTATYTPSPTPVPTNTPTLTPTAAPRPTGLTTVEQPDGATLVIDYDNNFQFSLPVDWVVLPLTVQDFADMLRELGEENSEIAEIAESFAELDPDVVRLVALNESPKYLFNGFATNFTVVVFEDKIMAAMPMEFITAAIVESVKSEKVTILSGSGDVGENPNGIEFGLIDSQQTAPTTLGSPVEVRSRIILFKTDDKVTMINLSTPDQFGDELLPVLDYVVDSIDQIDP